jgi:hypothetical protein
MSIPKFILVLVLTMGTLVGLRDWNYAHNANKFADLAKSEMRRGTSLMTFLAEHPAWRFLVFSGPPVGKLCPSIEHKQYNSQAEDDLYMWSGPSAEQLHTSDFENRLKTWRATSTKCNSVSLKYFEGSDWYTEIKLEADQALVVDSDTEANISRTVPDFSKSRF